MFFTALLCFTSILIVWSWIKVLKDYKRTNIPGPFPLPIVGSGYVFAGGAQNFLPNLAGLQKRYKDAVLIYLLSQKNVIFSHPKYIGDILQNGELITKDEHQMSFIKLWLGDGLLTSSGEWWRAHRKFLTPGFHFDVLRSYLPAIYKSERKLKSELYNLADGTQIDLSPLLSRIALQMVKESVMGISTDNMQTDKEADNFTKTIEKLGELTAIRFLNPLLHSDMIYNLTSYRFREKNAVKKVNKTINAILKSRREELNSSENSIEGAIGSKYKRPFMELLLSNEAIAAGYDDRSIVHEVNTFMFAGHDTTTFTVSICLYLVSQHPVVQRKILNEQRSIFGDNFDQNPTFNELQQMKYLESVIKETLRLYPPAPLISRMIDRDSNIGGLPLAKGTIALVDIFHTHRNPDVYEDPLEFKPHRFEEHNDPFNWIPFSAGPRNCIGQKFAMMALKVLLSSVMRHFEVLPAHVEPKLIFGLTLKSENGINIKLLPRATYS